MEIDDDSSVHRLEASGPQTGGLVVKKKESGASSFKVPKPSLLGLDRLAAQKRKEREDAKRLISFKDSEYDDLSGTPSSDSVIRTPDVSSVHKLNRQYRETRVETPSHSGGVSEKARDRLAERSEKDKRGVYISSKDQKRERRDDDERDRYRRDRDRDRDRKRDRDRDRGSRDRDSRHGRDRDSSRRSDRRNRSDSERSLHTPRFKDEPRTPLSGKILSSTSWDDDDDKPPVKKSQWDFPTPKDGSDSKRPDWSTRSSSSSIYRAKGKSNVEDDTPRPTPAHKYNAWANDRKRSGATPQTGIVCSTIVVIRLQFHSNEILLLQVVRTKSNRGQMKKNVTCGKRSKDAWIANGTTSTKVTTKKQIHLVVRATPNTFKSAKSNWNKQKRNVFRRNSVKITKTTNSGNEIVC